MANFFEFVPGYSHYIYRGGREPLFFLLLAFLVSIFLAFVSHLAQPWSMRLLREYMVQVRTDLLTQVIQPGRFSSPEANLMFHIRDRAADGRLIGLVMHDTRDKTQSQSYLAEHGETAYHDGGAQVAGVAIG